MAIDDLNLYYLKEATDTQWALEEHFLSTGEAQISHADWDAMSQDKVCTELASWANINKAIGQLCSQVPCDYETVKLVNDFTTRMETVSGLTLH